MLKTWLTVQIFSVGVALVTCSIWGFNQALLGYVFACVGLLSLLSLRFEVDVFVTLDGLNLIVAIGTVQVIPLLLSIIIQNRNYLTQCLIILLWGLLGAIVCFYSILKYGLTITLLSSCLNW